MTDIADDVLVIPEAVCAQFVETIAAQPGVGHVGLLRELGVVGRRGQIREAIDRQLRADIDRVRNDAIRTELYRRGIDGVTETVWHNGEQVGEKVVYSDRCLIALAQMKLPEARNQLDVNLAGQNGGPVRVEVEGDRVTGIGDVVDLAVQLGIPSVVGRLAAAAARGALPPAPDVLPDPSDG